MFDDNQLATEDSLGNKCTYFIFSTYYILGVNLLIIVLHLVFIIIIKQE